MHIVTYINNTFEWEIIHNKFAYSDNRNRYNDIDEVTSSCMCAWLTLPGINTKSIHNGHLFPLWSLTEVNMTTDRQVRIIMTRNWAYVLPNSKYNTDKIILVHHKW